MLISSRTTIPVDSELPARGSTLSTILESTNKGEIKDWGRRIGGATSAKDVADGLGFCRVFGFPDVLADSGLTAADPAQRWRVDRLSAHGCICIDEPFPLFVGDHRIINGVDFLCHFKEKTLDHHNHIAHVA
eukprot:scaffold104284_cov64-Attheya_sp.AAC.2